jgi:hypothetical protein
MHTVAMLLKLLGMGWADREETFYEILQVPLDCYKALKLYWWPPPEKVKQHRLTRKKLLLTSLSIAAMKATHAAPDIEFQSQQSFKRVIRKFSRNGMLMTARMSTEGASQVRQALESLPASLYTPDDSKNLIIDTGES